MTTPRLDARAPASLQRLHALFSSLEFSLSSLALYQHTSDWDAVKRAVESSSQTSLTKQDLQQLLWLVPSAYSVTWSRRPASRKRARANAGDGDDRDPEQPVLVIRRQRLTPSTEDDAAAETLTQRIAFFTDRVNTLVQDHTDNAEIEIGTVPLPEPDTASPHDASHARFAALAAERAREVTPTEIAAALAAPVPEDLQTLPQWLIDKVRRQEQQHKKAAERSDAAQKHRLYTTLPQLSDQIQSLVLVQRKRVFALPTIVKQLMTKAPMRDQIEEQIHLLESLVPFWITVFFSDGQSYVKLSTGHKYNAVKSALRKAIATMV